MIFRAITFLAVLILFSSCATKPSRTKYGPRSSYGGYIDEESDKQVLFSTFAGNAYTKKNTAEWFASFRAVEVCFEKGLAATRIFAVVDLSAEEVIRRSSTSISENSFGAWGSTHTWNDTYTYPTFSAVYLCTNKIHEIPIKVKTISPEDMKTLVKDLLGAVQVTLVKESDAEKSQFEEGDIIYKIGNRRIQNVIDFFRQVNKLPDHSSISISVFREGKETQIKAAAKDVTAYYAGLSNDILDIACAAREMKGNELCMATGKEVAIADPNNLPLWDRFLESLNTKK